MPIAAGPVESLDLCVSCASPASQGGAPDASSDLDLSPLMASPGRVVNFTDSNFARALQRRELAAQNPTYDADRSLAMMMNISEEDGFKAEAGDNLVRVLFTCRLCGLSCGMRGTVAVDECAHHVCVGCMRAHVLASLSQLDGPAQVGCPLAQCMAHLSIAEIRRFAGAGAYDGFVDRRLQQHMAETASGTERFVRCPACAVSASVQPVTPREALRRARSEAPARGADGAPLITPHRVHFVNHRFRCTACAADFCGACGNSPYHLGHTCEQWAEAKRAPHCRFCEVVLPRECACAAEPEPAVPPAVGEGGALAALAQLPPRLVQPAVRHAAPRARQPLRHAAFSAAKRFVLPRVWLRVARPHAREPLGGADANREERERPPQSAAHQRAHCAGREAVVVDRALAPRHRAAAEPLARPVDAAKRPVPLQRRPAPEPPVERASTLAVRCRRVMGGERSWQTCCAAECVERGADACLRVLACGHPCCGVRGEAEADCLGCLRPECAQLGARSSAECADDLCAICWSEPLVAAPSVRLGCSHVIHLHCLRERLRQRWAGRAVNFEFKHCPLCKASVTHAALAELLAPHDDGEKALRSRALERLHYDGLDKAFEVMNEAGSYYKRPVEFALSRYVYYECYRCKLPYYGGLAACAVDLDRRAEAYDPREQVCGGCSAADGAPNTRCGVHGRDYIEYKCRFCCNVASWYCWGNTHFCGACHDEASTVQPKACTCGKPHPPNGVEFARGCALCHATAAF